MKKHLLSTAAVAATLLFASCKGGEPVDLKLNLQPGSKYLYTLDTKMSMEQSAMGQTMKTDNDMTMETTYDVAGAEGNNKRLTVTYDRIAMRLKNPMADMSYDSRDSAGGDPSLRNMNNILHKPFSMVVTNQGEILKVEGLSDIINSMGDTTAAGMEVRKQLSSTFNDTAIKSMMQQSLNIFPDKPVKPGESWKKTYTMNMSIMNLKIDNEFKLTSVTNGIAHLDVNARISGGGAMTGEEMKNMQINLGGDQKGTMDVEVATGLVTDSKLKQNIKGDISMMGMKIPLTMTQDIHITAKKK
jgi:hypothetical protein